jgi:AcrR family transcriptional regulator
MKPPRTRLTPEARRQQILDVANALFAERGYEEVSIETIARSAGVARGLIHYYFGGRKEVYLALLERQFGRLTARFAEVGLRPAEGTSPTARVADTVSRWLDWAEANRTIYLGTLAPGDDLDDPEVRRVVGELRRLAVVHVVGLHPDIAEDSPRLHHALECWTGLNRTATRRWLEGGASREATHTLLTLTLDHILRTFGGDEATPDPGL